MKIAEEILQEFPGQQGSGSFIEGVVPDTRRSQGDPFLLEQGDHGTRRRLKAVYAEVIGKGRCKALQKGFKVWNNLSVFFK
jgi:hypothetical protein